jgi:hypothetical protein
MEGKILVEKGKTSKRQFGLTVNQISSSDVSEIQVSDLDYADAICLK